MTGAARPIAICVALALAGCHGSITNSSSGRNVPDDVLEQIDLAETDADWLLISVGRPQEIRDTDTGELWVYRYDQTFDKPGRSEWAWRKVYIDLTESGRINRVWAEEAESDGWATRYE